MFKIADLGEPGADAGGGGDIVLVAPPGIWREKFQSGKNI